MQTDFDASDEFRDRLLLGDEAALADLMDLHRQRLWRIVNFRMDRRLIGRVDADDILQDAFVDAAKRLSHYASETGEKQFSPFVWLRLIVGQTLIDVHRRHLGTQRRDASREAPKLSATTSASMADYLSAHLTSPSHTAMRTETRQQLRDAVEAMEPIDREVLALRHFEELTNQEVAQVLETTQKTASIRYVRALARLKTILEKTSGMEDLFPKK